ncbi:nitrogen fixation protein NifZ [Aestuariirhabdus litorea]|uniref:Nitrogen fixation protein NifZ n=1 Tax=Aestuariirhabdus litorea TaxID=2528527 RepID=A0A3P3VM46_9GAMM|nr:nitrogen fixation protein NifZ [Aestuariirhabdus litorea]RRJ82948.1 nitrogen fixation protein NifZ [Aestuariirhabdus litorea]RWW93107.1 nitrogen fixation protein NifZ [Endozoicomonadaceae bacterium GTF-13]
MRAQYDYGDPVRVIRTLRDDGTYPGKHRGERLVKRGSIGHVVDVGTFLQDQLIYRVHFLDDNIQVGCREEELIAASAPWVESRFEFLQPVQAVVDLAVDGAVVVERGDHGQVLKVLRSGEAGAAPTACYQVRFTGRTLQVPERVLQECSQ